MFALSLIFLFSKLENSYHVLGCQKHHICGVAMVARAKMISVDLCRIKLKGGLSSLQIREFCFKLLSVGIDQGFSCRGTKVRGFAMQLQLLFIV